MKHLIEINLDHETFLTHASETFAGHGHRKIECEFQYRGKTFTLRKTTDNMPAFDEAKDVEGYEEGMIALYEIVAYQIEDAIYEQCQRIDWDLEEEEEN